MQYVLSWLYKWSSLFSLFSTSQGPYCYSGISFFLHRKMVFLCQFVTNFSFSSSCLAATNACIRVVCLCHITSLGVRHFFGFRVNMKSLVHRQAFWYTVYTMAKLEILTRVYSYTFYMVTKAINSNNGVQENAKVSHLKFDHVILSNF